MITRFGDRRRHMKFFVFLFFLAGLSALTYMLAMNFFSLQTIEVVGDGVALEVDPKGLPRNMLFFPTEELAANLKRDYPLLGNVAVRKKFPHTLVIVATARLPAAEFVSQGKTVVLDREGYVISYDASSMSLPVIAIETESSFQLGTKIADPRIGQSLLLLSATRDFIRISRIEIGEGASLRAIVGNTNIIVAQDGQMADKAATLQTLLAGVRIKGTLPTMIDLRFDKPIITY